MHSDCSAALCKTLSAFVFADRQNKYNRLLPSCGDGYNYIHKVIIVNNQLYFMILRHAFFYYIFFIYIFF